MAQRKKIGNEPLGHAERRILAAVEELVGAVKAAYGHVPEDPEALMTIEVLRLRDRLTENLGTAEEAAFRRKWGFLTDDAAAVEYSRTGPRPRGR